MFTSELGLALIHDGNLQLFDERATRLGEPNRQVEAVIGFYNHSYRGHSGDLFYLITYDLRSETYYVHDSSNDLRTLVNILLDLIQTQSGKRNKSHSFHLATIQGEQIHLAQK